ncbi:MAG: hypothetical protein KatS3mg051_0686 [Anaerolineae bacterium]|nr:MAG: hypothetical protein KatS3mg051_0686 [Anaerolineae bacterium]
MPGRPRARVCVVSSGRRCVIRRRTSARSSGVMGRASQPGIDGLFLSSHACQAMRVSHPAPGLLGDRLPGHRAGDESKSSREDNAEAWFHPMYILVQVASPDNSKRFKGVLQGGKRILVDANRDREESQSASYNKTEVLSQMHRTLFLVLPPSNRVIQLLQYLYRMNRSYHMAIYFGPPHLQWYYDDKGYYAYILLNSSEVEWREVQNLLEQHQLRVLLAGPSHRPASNGRQYDWYIRICDKDWKHPSPSIVKQILTDYETARVPRVPSQKRRTPESENILRRETAPTRPRC